MNMISKTAQYALQGMTLLASQSKRMTVKELAKEIGAPQPYLARIIVALTKAGLVQSRRGPGGGLTLGRAPESISFFDIITCFDGSEMLDHCAMGFKGCSAVEHHCPLHSAWHEAREKLWNAWRHTTLRECDVEMMSICIGTRLPEAWQSTSLGIDSPSQVRWY